MSQACTSHSEFMRILKELPVFNQRTEQKKTHWFTVGPLTGFFDWIRIWVIRVKTGSMISENQWWRMMRTSNGLRVEAGLIPVLITHVIKAVTLHKKNLYGKHSHFAKSLQAERPIIYCWLTWELQFSARGTSLHLWGKKIQTKVGSLFVNSWVDHGALRRSRHNWDLCLSLSLSLSLSLRLSVTFSESPVGNEWVTTDNNAWSSSTTSLFAVK